MEGHLHKDNRNNSANQEEKHSAGITVPTTVMPSSGMGGGSGLEAAWHYFTKSGTERLPYYRKDLPGRICKRSRLLPRLRFA